MELDSVNQALAVIKPTETRIEGWQKVLPPIFNWENDELKKFAEIDIERFKVATPDKSHLPLLKEFDETLTRLKKLASDKEKERKDLLQPIEGMKKRMMVIEKAYTEIVEVLSPYYIKLKKVEQTELAKKQARADDLSRFRTEMQTKFNREQGLWNEYIQAKVTEVYDEALDVIEPADLTPYLNDIEWKHTEQVFVHAQCQIPTINGVMDADKVAIANDVFSNWNRKALADSFSSLLRQTFVGFDVAKNQKEQAKDIRHAEQVIEVSAIKENVEMENTLAVFDEKSTETITVEKTRGLKTVWKIDMEPTLENMAKIEKAFYGNKQACLATWQGKDFWKINTYDKAAMLCRLKDKDENFAVQDILFKPEDKL